MEDLYSPYLDTKDYGKNQRKSVESVQPNLT